MMIKSRIRLLSIVLFLAFAWGCDRETESPIVINNSVLPGDYLSQSSYTRLRLEIVSVSGFEPTQTSIDNLTNFLKARLNKPAGIDVLRRSISSPGRLTIDVDVLREMEKTHRTANTSGDILTAYIFFVDAEYSSSTSTSKVLGVAYGASSIAVFKKNVRDFTGGAGKPSTAALESVVLGHEFGHLLGLVNNGVSMVAPHQDTAHSAHCTATDCLMYYKAETNSITGSIMTGGIPNLDVNCLADLKAAGGK